MLPYYSHVKQGVLLSILSMLFSFILGGIFGLNEDALKKRLNDSAMDKFKTLYDSDEEKMKQVVSKSWVYFQRSHLHSGVLGIGALVLCLFLCFAGKNKRETIIASVCLGAGALIYGLYWLLAGWDAPSLGSTGAAKEAYKILGMGAPAIYTLGTLLTLKSAILYKKS